MLERLRHFGINSRPEPSTPSNLPACEWCGQAHAVEQLCQANSVGVTRRRFLFLFGAGVAGAVTAAKLGIDLSHLGQRAGRPLTFKDAVLVPNQYLATNEVYIMSRRTLDEYRRLLEPDFRYNVRADGFAEVSKKELERHGASEAGTIGALRRSRENFWRGRL